MIVSMTSISAYISMQAILPKIEPKVDSNLEIPEERKLEADKFTGIASRLGLSPECKLAEWEATKNVIAGDRERLIEVEMTELDRNTIIAILEYNNTEWQTVVDHYTDKGAMMNLVSGLREMIQLSKNAIVELSQINIQE